MFVVRRLAWASLLCAVASEASPGRAGRSVTATRPALKKQIAVESGVPATRLAQKSDGVKEAVVTPQQRSTARPWLNPRAPREHSVPVTSLATKRDEDDLLQTRGGAARREEAQEVAAVKNEKARLCTLHLSAAHVQPRPLA